METGNTSKISAKFYQTTLRNVPEDNHLHLNIKMGLTDKGWDVDLRRVLVQTVVKHPLYKIFFSLAVSSTVRLPVPSLTGAEAGNATVLSAHLMRLFQRAQCVRTRTCRSLGTVLTQM